MSNWVNSPANPSNPTSPMNPSNPANPNNNNNSISFELNTWWEYLIGYGLIGLGILITIMVIVYVIRI